MMDVAAPSLQHANRGVRLQLVLRGVLVVFVLLTIILLPPVQGAAGLLRHRRRLRHRGARVRPLGMARRRRRGAVPDGWGCSSTSSCWPSSPWSPGSRPSRAGPRTCSSSASSSYRCWRPPSCGRGSAPRWSSRRWSSTWSPAWRPGRPTTNRGSRSLLRTFMLASVGAACVGLSRIQRSRVAAIGGLLKDRTRLLDELVRSWRSASAGSSPNACTTARCSTCWRPDSTSTTRDTGAPTRVDRIEHALAESSRMLRSTVSELHPAVLERAGLARALVDLAAATARTDLTVDVDVDDWPDGLRTPVDALLFRTASELLSNVVKHADVRSRPRSARPPRRSGPSGRHRRRPWAIDEEARAAAARRRPHRAALAGAAHRGGGRGVDRRRGRLGDRGHRRGAARVLARSAWAGAGSWLTGADVHRLGE